MKKKTRDEKQYRADFSTLDHKTKFNQNKQIALKCALKLVAYHNETKTQFKL